MPNNPELIEEYGRFAEDLPDEDETVFDRSSLQQPALTVTTDRLVITTTLHEYGSFRVDLVRVYAQKQVCRCLGLLILSAVFHRRTQRTCLEITHPASQVRYLTVEPGFNVDWHSELPLGYHSVPHAFVYLPEDAEKHPWYHPKQLLEELPYFDLTNQDDSLILAEDWHNRNTLRLCRGYAAQVKFAELLLNAGRPESAVSEYDLECNVGFQGVGPGSAELALYLPGSDAWDPTFWKS